MRRLWRAAAKTCIPENWQEVPERGTKRRVRGWQARDGQEKEGFQAGKALQLRQGKTANQPFTEQRGQGLVAVGGHNPGPQCMDDRHAHHVRGPR